MFVSLIFCLQLCQSVSIIQFVTISMVRVVRDIFINQNALKLFIDFLLCVLLKSGTRGFFVLARVCSYCAGVNIFQCHRSHGVAIWREPKRQ